MRNTVVSTLLVLGLAAAGFAYVALSGAATVEGFDYARFEPVGDAAAPVKVAVIEDLRCPSCRKTNLEILPQALGEYVARRQVVVYHVPFTFTRSDSLALGVLARSHSVHHGVPLHEVNAALYRADSPRLSLEAAEALLVERFGEVAADAREELERVAAQRLRDDGKYLARLGISQTPTVIVDDVVLHAPAAALLRQHIELALARARSNRPG